MTKSQSIRTGLRAFSRWRSTWATVSSSISDTPRRMSMTPCGRCERAVRKLEMEVPSASSFCQTANRDGHQRTFQTEPREPTGRVRMKARRQHYKRQEQTVAKTPWIRRPPPGARRICSALALQVRTPTSSSFRRPDEALLCRDTAARSLSLPA